VSDIQTKDLRFVHLERKVGIFILVAFVGLAAVITMIGIQQDLFTPKTRIYFITESGTDLSDGQIVKFRGFKIGKVKKVSMNNQGKVEVKLAINNHYMKWIRIDSRARLVKEGFIGDSIIEITPGSPAKRGVEEGGRIAFERERGLSELAEQIRDQVTPVIEDIKKIIKDLDNPQGDFRTILANIHKFSNNLVATSEHLDAVLLNIQDSVNEVTANVGDLSGTIKKELVKVTANVDELSASVETNVIPEIESVLKNMDRAVSSVDQTASVFRQDLENVLKAMDNVLKNVKETIEDLKKASASVPGLVDKGEDLMGESQKIMESVQDIWLFRPKAANPDDKILKMDSYE